MTQYQEGKQFTNKGLRCELCRKVKPLTTFVSDGDSSGNYCFKHYKHLLYNPFNNHGVHVMFDGEYVILDNT